jgi:hypothetical protein
MNRESIRRFVREDLGCGCPEEVFDDIALASRDAGSDGPRYTRLLIGNRLLVYVMTATHGDELAHDTGALAARGVAERDEAGYNRFRLVAVFEPGCPGSSAATAAFRQAVAGDDRATLHCLEAASIPSSLIPAGSAARTPMPGRRPV